MRLGRWTPVFVTVEDPQTRQIDLQIHGSYGEKGEAIWLHQTAVAQSLPVTYGLLFPINAQLSRIEVVVSDLQTGKTLGTQRLQNNASFSPAGNVPTQVLGTNDTLIGISGNVDDALWLEAQLDRAQIPAGVIDPLKLPANFAGYDGINALILAAADIAALTGEQERAILDWVRRGGNLLQIPGTSPLPPKSALMDALPCAIGENFRMFVSGGPGDKGGPLNARKVSPRPGAEQISIPDGLTEYVHRWGLGKIAVVPVDISPMVFGEAAGANRYWKTILDPMVKVPEVNAPSERVVSEEDQYLVSGPNAAESFGRGQRESDAIRHILELFGTTGTAPGGDWKSALLVLAGIFFLVGPIDSVILFRFGQPPRNWVTLIGWIGLVVSTSLYGIGNAVHAHTTVSTFRLVDQVDDERVGATDVIAVNSDLPGIVPPTLDKNEWWEPANQAARSFSADRFVDAQCREDKTGCRPEFVRLNGREAQAWHGETTDVGAKLLDGSLFLKQDHNGKVYLAGNLTNDSQHEMRDILVMWASGSFRLGQNLPPGASLDVSTATGPGPMSLNGLPEDVGDVAPERADRMDALMKSGHAIVICSMPDATDVNVGLPVDQHWQVLRAALLISHNW